MPISIQLEFTDKDVAALLCSAIEGGVNYWCASVDAKLPPNGECAKPWGDDYTPDYIAAPFTEGGSIVLKHDAENDREGAASQQTTIDRAVMQKGLAIMAQKHPMHFARFIGDGGDAETGDVFVQCCVFGKIIFG